jgi:cobalamin biosynthesis protein CobT
MLTKGIEVQKYVRASAGRAGLSVVFEESNQPRHNGRTIFLPRITSHTTDQQLKELMCSTDHEVAHDRFSSFDILHEIKVDPNSALMFVWNFLEDSRVNVIEAKEYKGFRENWDESNSVLVQKVLDRTATEKTSISKLVSALICWDGAVCQEYFPLIQLVTSSFEQDKKVMDVLHSYSDHLVHCHQILDKRLGTKSTYDLALEILQELGESCKEELKDKSPSEKRKDKSEEEGSTKDAKGSTKSEFSGSIEDKGDTESKEKTPEEEYKIIEIKLTKEDLEKFSLTMPEHGGTMSKVGVNFTPVDLVSGTWDLTDYEKFVVVNYPKQLGDARYFNLKATTEFIRDYTKRVADKLVAQENFAQQVRKLIQVRARVQTQYGQKKGKLDQSRLSRICFNAPGFNERIFKNKIDNKLLDAAVTVLVDMSGSMGGDKVYYALASTILLNEVCSTLNIPLEIIGFTDGYSKSEVVPVMFVYKAFSDLRVSSSDLINYFAQSSFHMAGNPDGENIVWTHDRLIKRKERKKLLIVMSDGSPAASKSSSGLERFTIKVIKEIEKAKVVSIYGLGLCSSSVEEYYVANSVVNNPETIPTNLLTLIEKKIINV